MEKIEHLKFIQNVIDRMARNSFMLKGWSVTLIAGIFVLANKNADVLYFFLTYIPVIIFWLLDSYYLFQECLYRSLYDKTRTTANDNIDFSLEATVDEFRGGKNRFFRCAFSRTELSFYLSLAAVCTGIIIVTQWINL